MLALYCEARVSWKAGESSSRTSYYLPSSRRGGGGNVYDSLEDLAKHLNRTAAALHQQGSGELDIKLFDGVWDAEEFTPSGRYLQILRNRAVVVGETSRDNYLLQLQKKFMETTR